MNNMFDEHSSRIWQFTLCLYQWRKVLIRRICWCVMAGSCQEPEGWLEQRDTCPLFTTSQMTADDFDHPTSLCKVPRTQHKSGWWLIHCGWTASIEQPSSPLSQFSTGCWRCICLLKTMARRAMLRLELRGFQCCSLCNSWYAHMHKSFAKETTLFSVKKNWNTKPYR